MPAEWEPHAATWLAWPHHAEDWPGKFQPIPWVYAEIVRHLSHAEDVHMLVENEAAERRARAMLKRGGANMARIHFHAWQTDRVWLRDSGPIFTRDRDGSLSITNWHFNAWAKYDNWRRDDLVPHLVAQSYGMAERKPCVTLADGTEHRLVLEGGSIDVNGAGGAADDRGVSVVRGASSVTRGSRGRNWNKPFENNSAYNRWSGCIAVARETIRTATSTTSRALSARTGS